MTVWQCPPSRTRSPSSRQSRRPVRLLAWKRGELIAAEALGPIGHQRRMSGAGDRVLVDPEVRHEHAADDVALVARRAVTTAMRGTF